MTGMEQCLRYIEMEIRYMVKDQFGNPTNAKYADRVIADACGIPNFCTIVLSSKRPLTAILRAVRGPKGDAIVRFFNVSLHDARMEMVMVLTEASKLAMRHSKSAKESHDYLAKLYKKAIKRTVNIVNGGKGKNSYKTVYRNLRNYANMDDFEIDDDDDDFFGPDTENEYIDACIDAYRDGKTPPEMPLRAPYRYMPNNDTLGNEELLKEIAAHEARIGRPLTDIELEKIFFEDDDDDDSYKYPTRSVSNLAAADSTLDSIVDIIYEKLKQRFSADNASPVQPVTQDESIDEFIERQIEKKKVQTQIPESENVVVKSVPLNPTYGINKSPIPGTPLEMLVGIHNRANSGSTPQEPDESQPEGSDDNDYLPPDQESGGNISHNDNSSNTEDDTGVVGVYITDSEDQLNVTVDIVDHNNSTESKDSINLLEPSTMSPHMDHILLIGDIIRDFATIDHESAKKRLSNHLNQIGVIDHDIFMCVAPSDNPEKLLKLIVDIRTSGDFEIINEMQLNMVANIHVRNIAETIGISEDLIELAFSLTDSKSGRDQDIKSISSNRKDENSVEIPKSVSEIYTALSQIVTYIYNRTNELVDIRFIYNDETVNIYFLPKNKDFLEESVSKCIYDELRGENIDEEIFSSVEDILWNRDYCIYTCSALDANDKYLDVLMNVMSDNSILEYTENNKLFINRYLYNIFGKDSDEISIEIDKSISKNNLVFDVIYRVYTKYEIDDSVKTELIADLETNAEYRIREEALLNAISLNIRVTPYVTFNTISQDDDLDDSNGVLSERTSNFGI